MKFELTIELEFDTAKGENLGDLVESEKERIYEMKLNTVADDLLKKSKDKFNISMTGGKLLPKDYKIGIRTIKTAKK